MSNETTKKWNGERTPPDQPPAQNENTKDDRFQLHIFMDPQGNVQVSGGIGNQYLAYGVLEMAKDAIRRYHEQRSAPRIVPPEPDPPRSPFGRH